MGDPVRWTLDRYGLDEGQFDVSDFETAMLRRKYQYKRLLQMLDTRGMLDDGALVDAMTAVQRVMNAAHHSCFELFVLFNRMEGVRNVRIPPTVTDEETLDSHDPEQLTSFQRLLLYILKRIEVKKYRKCGDSCFERLLSPEGHNTRAYVYACSIQDVVYEVQKELNFQMWKFFTSPRDNPKAVHEHLCKSKQAEFPELDVGEGCYYAFADGIYDVLRDLFFVYEEEPHWPAYAKAMQEARGISSAGGEGEGEEEEVHPSRRPYKWPTDESVCLNYFDMPFRFRIRPTDPDVADFDPFSIPTPTLEGILYFQG